MFCSNCGRQLPDGAKFCGMCGTPVTQVDPMDAPTVILGEPEPVAAPVFADTEQVGAADAEPAFGTTEQVGAADIGPVFGATEQVGAADAGPVFGATEQIGASDAEPVFGATEQVGAADAGPVFGATEQVGQWSADPFYPDGGAQAPAEEPPKGKKKRGRKKDKGQGGGPDQPGGKKKKTGLIVGVAIGAVALAALVFAAVKFLPGLLGGKGSDAIVYVNSDGELMYLSSLKKNAKAVEVCDDLEDSTGAVGISPDGKSVYYRDGDSSLYRATRGNLKKDGPDRVAKEAGDFSVLKNGGVLFEKEDGSLNFYDGKDSFRLVKECWGWRLSEDEKTVYYTVWDGDSRTQTLYRTALKEDAEAERLIKDADIIYTPYDSDVLVYTQGGADPGDGFTVYSCKPGEKGEKLAEDVYMIQDIRVEDGKVRFLYGVQNTQERTLYDYVSDRMAAEDSATLGGEEPVYPSWSDYYPDEYYISNGAVYYKDRRGNEYPVDVSGLLTDGRTVDDLYYWEVNEIGYADARQRYDAVLEDYNARRDAWREADNRESIRRQLRENTQSQATYDVYLCDGGADKEPLFTGVVDMSGDMQTGIYFYSKAESIGKVADVADLNYAGEVYDLISSGSGGQTWYQNVGGRESELELGEDARRITDVFVLNGEEVLLCVADDDWDMTLRAYSLGSDSLTFTDELAGGDEVSGPFVMTDPSGKEVLYLFADPREDSNGEYQSDLCAYRDGKLETIAGDVYGAAVLNESGTVYAVTGRDGDACELAVLRGEELVTVSDEISDHAEPIFLDGQRLLYVTTDGDLYLWDGEDSRRLARDVEAGYVWAASQESYSFGDNF